LTRVGEVRRHLRNLTWEMSWSVRDKGKREGNIRGGRSGMGTGTTNRSRFQDLYVH
jgi:hypothetical protein